MLPISQRINKPIVQPNVAAAQPPLPPQVYQLGVNYPYVFPNLAAPAAAPAAQPAVLAPIAGVIGF